MGITRTLEWDQRVICPRCGTENLLHLREDEGPFFCRSCGNVLVNFGRPSSQEEEALSTRTLEIEAASLDEARMKAKANLPVGFSLHSEEVISDGTPKSVKAFAENADAALIRAQGQIPANAAILDTELITSPELRTISVEAHDESSAKNIARGQLGEAGIIRTVKLVVPGKKGILGIGKTINRYEVSFLQQAVIVLTYMTAARIKFTLKEQKYEFTNPQFYARRPLSELKGLILLAPEGEEEPIARSRVFAGTVEDTVRTWIKRIEAPKILIGHPKTRMLFRRAQEKERSAHSDIVRIGVGACRNKTQGAFPPGPVLDHHSIIRALPQNEITGSCFIVIFVY